MKSLLRATIGCLIALPHGAQALSLDELFSDVLHCKFPGFFYAPWDPPVNPYFVERDLQPYKEQDGLYYFHVSDTLFGLPVRELIVPGTWDYHLVVFDAPAVRVRQVLRTKFRSSFPVARASQKGEAPYLDTRIEAGRSIVTFGCSDRMDAR